MSTKVIQLEKELAQAKAHVKALELEITEQVNQCVREKFCIKVVCLNCRGSGKVDSLNGQDVEPCYKCEQRGFNWAVLWEDFNTLKDANKGLEYCTI